MQNRRVITVVIGAALCLGAIVAAQDEPQFSAEKIVQESGRTTLTGHVVLTVNGLVVTADRAVMQDGKVALEGNVRLTLPKPTYTAAAMRERIRTQERITTPARITASPSGPRQIDTPIPQPWQPPARDQR